VARLGGLPQLCRRNLAATFQGLTFTSSVRALAPEAGRGGATGCTRERRSPLPVETGSGDRPASAPGKARRGGACQRPGPGTPKSAGVRIWRCPGARTKRSSPVPTRTTSRFATKAAAPTYRSQTWPATWKG
jgi:hypothetical protein